MPDDIPARVRSLEDARARHGEDLAGLKSDVRNQGELVRAVAPLVGDLATVRGVANDGKAGVERIEKRLEKVEEDFGRRLEKAEDDLDRRRFNRLTVMISVAGTVIAFAGLIFVILTFASAG